MKKIQYIPQNGVCSKSMMVELDDNEIIVDVKVEKGCPGNSMGLAALLTGMHVNEAIKRLEGVKCRDLDTSCPDQLAKAMKQLL